MTRRVLCLFTRTPLHVGEETKSGATDRPLLREKHTGLPVIPGATLKAVFADAWSESGRADRSEEAAWLFGPAPQNEGKGGVLHFTDAVLLAFPIRSARGGFGWITSPQILQRAARDGVIALSLLPDNPPDDDKAIFARLPLGMEAGQPPNVQTRIVLEEYTFGRAGDLPSGLGQTLAGLLPGDPVWKEIANRLVIVSDATMSFFTQTACDVTRRMRVNPATGTAAPGALFSQENVPSETMFYATLTCDAENDPAKKPEHQRTGQDAARRFTHKLQTLGPVFQVGGSGSIGHGLCSVEIREPLA
ncbi:MAG: type III-B CRISPR module RAMP protein Cmr4 [Verrucomicrobiae bacterium]|nr:type III-B CRISPR module RAMP protein Cmr4 [Verrucomicrobiae bacterium]